MRRLIISGAGFLLFAALVHPASGQLSIRGSKEIDPSAINPGSVERPKFPVAGAVRPGPRAAVPPPAAVPADQTAPPSDANRGGGRPDRDRDRGDGRRDRGRNSRGHHHHGQGWGGYPWGWGMPYFPGAYYAPTWVFGYNVGLPVPFDPAPGVIPQNNPANPPAPAPVPADALRTTNPEQRARAGRFLGFGDAQFAKQKYLAAIGRYKTAIETAPDLADGYMRQGFAHVALGQYPNAAKAFRRGLTLRNDWRDSPFRLEALYVDAPISKTQHLENLAKAVEDNPFDADLLLTLGLELYFDDQKDRAAVFLSRVAQFGGDENLIKFFLQAPKPAGAPNVAPPRAGGKVVF